MKTGDLVKIKENGFSYFCGRLAVVKEAIEPDAAYYILCVNGIDGSHVFNRSEIELLSKAQKNNE